MATVHAPRKVERNSFRSPPNLNGMNSVLRWFPQGLTVYIGIVYVKKVLFLWPQGREWGIGKLVRIQHGPATVIGDENRSDGHCLLGGWEGRG
jgi:hypothetical protein